METSNTNLFEAASRLKLRFPFKGTIATEELWDLSLESLDAVYKLLNAQSKLAKEESLLTAKTRTEDELSLRLEIVKHIVAVKIFELDERLKTAERKTQKAKLLEILAEKQDESLKSKTPEEIRKMIEDLG